MAIQKVIQVFLSLKPAEQREFKKILDQKSIVNRANYSLILFTKLCYLEKNGKKNWKKMSPEELSQHAFKSPLSRTQQDKNKRNSRFSTLLQQLIDYLLLKKLEGESNLKTRLLLEVYKERRLNNLASKFLDKKKTL